MFKPKTIISIIIVIMMVTVLLPVNVLAANKLQQVTNFNAVKVGASDKAKLTWTKVSGATSYRIYRSAKKTSGFKAIKTLSKTRSSYVDSSRKVWGRYYYKIYASTNMSTVLQSSSSATKSVVVKTTIMGSSEVTASQLASFYRKYASYPSYYGHNAKDSTVNTINKFCQLYIDECSDEGVRADVAFCQAMLETGWLRYGGDVKRSQFNFAGMGATGGVTGASFKTVKAGIRAQVQHLKAYGGTESLNHKCIDKRFKYVSRGSAKYVEWLGIQENPYNNGWASGKNYGYYIMKCVNSI